MDTTVPKMPNDSGGDLQPWMPDEVRLQYARHMTATHYFPEIFLYGDPEPKEEPGPEDVNSEIIQAGKGDALRPVDKEEYNKNFDEVFGETRKHVCSRFVKCADGTMRCYFCNEIRPY